MGLVKCAIKQRDNSQNNKNLKIEWENYVT